MNEKQSHIFRRLFHMAAPVFLVYYLIPGDLWGFMDKRLCALFTVLTVLVIEVFRILMGWPKAGFRHYEGERISAVAWAAVGLGILMLFFPMILVVPALCGLAWIDPIIGEMRRRGTKGYPLVPALLYTSIWVVSLHVLSGLSLSLVLFFSIGATVIAISIESLSLKRIDDDFLMQVAPAALVYLFYLILL